MVELGKDDSDFIVHDSGFDIHCGQISAADVWRSLWFVADHRHSVCLPARFAESPGCELYEPVENETGRSPYTWKLNSAGLDANSSLMKYEDLPLVTVAIPLYNHARYVEKCLESISEETYPKIEVLVLDDGSTDASFEIVEKWHSKRKQLFSNFILERQSNQGISRTINKLVTMANGEYIALLASDDYLLPGGIEARNNHLEKNPHLLAVFGDCLVVNEHEDVICQSGVSQFHFNAARIAALKNEKLFTLEMILRWSVPGPVFLMRKSTFDIIGYYDESLTFEDRDYYLRLLTRGALGFVDYIVACYRWHANNFAKSPIGLNRGRESLSVAALKASRMATGILRIVLILDAKRISNPGWRKAMKNSGIAGAVNSICISAMWTLLKIYQNIRLWGNRCHP